MKTFLVAAMIALLIAPAYAQKKTDEERKVEKAQQEAADKAYRSSADRIPEKEAIDPWGNVRNTATPTIPGGASSQKKSAPK